LFIGVGILYVFQPTVSASAMDLTVSDSVAPTTDFLVPFGSLEVGKAPVQQNVTIANTGTVTRSLVEIKVLGEGAAAFTLDVYGGANPCRSTTPAIAPGGNCTLSLSFSPGTTGLHTSFLNVSLEEEKIAFHNDQTNGISIYGVSTAGISPFTTQFGGPDDDHPSWSPDGAQLTFHRNSAVYRMQINGAGQTLISDVGIGGSATMPDWSPDGQKIVMRGNSFGGLFLFDLGLNQYNNIPGASSVSGERFSPDWSPDSQKIVFQQDPPTGPNPVTINVFTMNLDATGQNLIALGAKTPAWSPDGKKIAFQDDASNRISTADAGGGVGTTVPLTTPPSGREDSQPSWSPDGQKIVFRRATDTDDNTIGDLMIIDATNGSTLATIPAQGRTPAWSPASVSNVTLTGTGLAVAGANNAPTAPILISPENGQTGLPPNVEFKWLASSDPDGDTLTYELLLCKTADYPASCPAPTVVAKLMITTPFYVAGGGFVLFGIVWLGVPIGGDKKRLGSIALILGLVILGACSSGGGGSSPPAGSGGGGTELSRSEGGLLTNTEYNWQVTAKDGKGGVTPSLLRTFTTAP